MIVIRGETKPDAQPAEAASDANRQVRSRVFHCRSFQGSAFDAITPGFGVIDGRGLSARDS